MELTERIDKIIIEAEEPLNKEVERTLGKTKAKVSNVLSAKDIGDYVRVLVYYPDTPKQAFTKLNKKFQTQIVGDWIKVWRKK